MFRDVGTYCFVTNICKKKYCFDVDVIQFRQHPSFNQASVFLFALVLQECVPGYLNDFAYSFLHN